MNIIVLNEFESVCTENTQNDSYVVWLLAEKELFYNQLILNTDMCSNFNKIQTPLGYYHYIFGLSFPNLWNERLAENIKGLVSGGIVDFHFKKYERRKIIDSDVKIYLLDFNDIIFGFGMCFIFLYISFLVFLIEVIAYYIRKSVLLVKIAVTTYLKNIVRNNLTDDDDDDI